MLDGYTQVARRHAAHHSPAVASKHAQLACDEFPPRGGPRQGESGWDCRRGLYGLPSLASLASLPPDALRRHGVPSVRQRRFWRVYVQVHKQEVHRKGWAHVSSPGPPQSQRLSCPSKFDSPGFPLAAALA